VRLTWNCEHQVRLTDTTAREGSGSNTQAALLSTTNWSPGGRAQPLNKLHCVQLRHKNTAHCHLPCHSAVSPTIQEKWQSHLLRAITCCTVPRVLHDSCAAANCCICQLWLRQCINFGFATESLLQHLVTNDSCAACHSKVLAHVLWVALLQATMHVCVNYTSSSCFRPLRSLLWHAAV
jgi:hypothetical protein